MFNLLTGKDNFAPMQLFYSRNIGGAGILLENEEARHAMLVLRKKVGDPIEITDGSGNLYICTIKEAGKKDCLCEVKEVRHSEKRDIHLHIALAPVKNMDRTEWFVEKCTEIGIEEFSFVVCEHSERKVLKTERLHKIILSASKQSYKMNFPVLNEAEVFANFISGNEDYDHKYIATCAGQEISTARDITEITGKVLILIGPEGDFSDAEIELAKNRGFKTLSLGNARLRTETAGIVACVHFNLIFDKQ